MIRAYLSGPMTGRPDHNRAEFDAATIHLRDLGYDVHSPVEDGIKTYGSWEASKEHSWREHLARDVAVVPTCDVVTVLPGWEDSRGACLEVRIARTLGKTVMDAYTLREFSLAELDGTTHPGDVPAPLDAVVTPPSQETLGEATTADETPFEFYEDNPRRFTYSTGGIKENVGKTPLDLVPSKAVVAMADVLAFGARKYGKNNYRKGLPWSDTFASLQRHLLAWNDGEDNDPETGLSHIAHALCQTAFIMEFVLTETGTDDRWKAAL